MKYSILIFILCVLVGGTSCNDTVEPSENYMILNEVNYIQKFPYTFEISPSPIEDWDIIGLKYFAIKDTLLIVSTTERDALWAFYSLKTHKHLDSFLKIGNGPYEFTTSPNLYETTFYQIDNTLYAGIYDFNKGTVYKMNISESLKTNELSMSVLQDSIPNTLFNFAIINDSTYFCKELADNVTRQKRYILISNKKKSVPLNLSLLNKSRIREREDINILSTIIQLNKTRDKIVEIPIGLNQINLYSIKGNFGKTICVGKHMDNIDKIQNKTRWNRLYTYADVRAYADFFAALYINEEEKTYQTERKKKPTIQFFDWNGNPLFELKTDKHITSFDIDLNSKILYLLDQKEDLFYNYDIKGIIENFNLNNEAESK